MKTLDKYTSLQEVINFVRNGRISFTRFGVKKDKISIGIHKIDYVLKNDTEFFNANYGYSFEDDQREKERNVPRTKIIPKGTKIELNIDTYCDKISYRFKMLSNEPFRYNFDLPLTTQEFDEHIEGCKKLIPQDLQFNSINKAAIYVKDCQICS